MKIFIRPFAFSGLAAIVIGAAAVRGQTPAAIRDVREEIRITSSDVIPGMQLTPVRSGTILPDGRIVTVHAQEGVVRVFAPSGQLIRVVGRLGNGPGEFRSPGLAGYVGDTLWVRDDVRGAYLLFAPDLKPALQLTMSGGVRFGVISNTMSLNGGSGKLIVTDRDGNESRSITYPMRQSAPQYEVPLASTTTVVVAPGAPPSRTRRVTQPLTAFTSFDLLPGGREGILTEDASIWGGQPGQFTIRRVTMSTGRISAPITVTMPARRVSQAQADSMIKANAEWLGLARDYWSRIKVPAYYPALRSITPSADGVLWLQDNVDPSSRLVIDLTGRALMRVRLPRDLRVFAVSRTHVWGVLLDTDDLPIIVRYRIV